MTDIVAGPEANEKPDATQQRQARLTLFTVGTGTLLSAMAGSTVTLALPSIASEMGVALHVVSWVMLAFLLSATVLMLIVGRAGDIFGHARVYLIGFFLFGFSSFAAGAAPSIPHPYRGAHSARHQRRHGHGHRSGAPDQPRSLPPSAARRWASWPPAPIPA